MHQIVCEEGAKPVLDGQRRLNSNPVEVVKKDILKLLTKGVIYPIADREWVIPVHVVPKKEDITVVKNEKEDIVPTRMTTRWLMCINYRKLNAAMRKNHFPLPFY